MVRHLSQCISSHADTSFSSPVESPCQLANDLGSRSTRVDEDDNDSDNDNVDEEDDNLSIATITDEEDEDASPPAG